MTRAHEHRDENDSARSWLMRRVRSKNSRAELTVRRAAHRLGYRFRLHRADLPGTPDLVFPGRRRVIFVHGCFWHRHADCRRASTPKSNVEFWEHKFARNVARDRSNEAFLAERGWKVLVIWECEIGDREALEHRLTTFLN